MNSRDDQKILDRLNRADLRRLDDHSRTRFDGDGWWSGPILFTAAWFLLGYVCAADRLPAVDRWIVASLAVAALVAWSPTVVGPIVRDHRRRTARRTR